MAHKSDLKEQIKEIMKAFGDENPVDDSVELFETLLVQFITEVGRKLGEFGKERGRTRLNDVLHLFPNNQNLSSNIAELIQKQNDFKKKKSQFGKN
ncbi:transcription initiation factor tfiid subunit 13 [Anaeramoeba ignava]|uniref:Transcription initiation factor tfiid subunit 13 n=1 Tax=Anaeramoeba ignava TaxID=1746090 RepID=A0A9Q0R575_ANAIG|nr:transcription initiation factor tfiid subunit 13 [Anaeramoeba ignava]